MNAAITQLSQQARHAASTANWPLVQHCAAQILQLDDQQAEGWFLQGLSLLAMVSRAGPAPSDIRPAVAAFERAIKLDSARYDAAIELAGLFWQMGKHAEAKRLLDSNLEKLSDSPKYLFKAAEAYSRLGLHADAWPQYVKANSLQPKVPAIQAAMASSAAKVGETERAIALYDELLQANPSHQRNHYERARLETAKDDARINTMLDVLAKSKRPACDNIFLNFALGKELEDRQRWAEAFRYYQAGADAAHQQCTEAGYRVEQDIALLEKIQSICTPEWMLSRSALPQHEQVAGQPIFVLGLPRSGTTLVEKIISAHSQLETADESFFLEMAIKRASKLRSPHQVTPSVIAAAAKNTRADIASEYLSSIAYRLKGEKLFVEKYPFNFLYIGFIRKHFPGAKIVLLQRDPMDVCFAMYKQPFFKFSYSQSDLAKYHQAYSKLISYWRDNVPGIVEVQYEELVADPERQISNLLSGLELEFEQTCVDYHENVTTSATASSIQVREKPHTRSIRKWVHWQEELAELESGLSL